MYSLHLKVLKVLWIFTLFLCYIFTPRFALAQAQPPAQEAATVPNHRSDQVIQQDISRVLTATAWFPKIEIRVEQGLVFIEGVYQSDQRKQWANDIINKTLGVVAVIDNAEVKTSHQDVLSPAKDELLQLQEKAYRSTPYIISGIAIFLLFIVLAFFSRSMSHKLMRRKKMSLLASEAISNLVLVFFFLMGTYLALNSSGLSSLAVTILGGTGIIGLGIGLALKNSFENYVSGLLISLRGIFKEGEVVKINDIEGVVQAVTSRSTNLIDYRGNNILIPNTQVFSSTIINYTRNPRMRLDFAVGIGYDDSIDLAKEVILATIRESQQTLNDPESFVIVDGLGASTVNLKVFFWVDSVRYSSIKIRSLIIQQVKQAMMQANISMPDDAREVLFASPLEVMQISQNDHQKYQQKATKTSSEQAPTHPSETDLSNEIKEIQKQAQTGETPEEGSNLLS